VLLGALVIKVLYFPTTYPTRSRPGELTLVLDTGFYHGERAVITLRYHGGGQTIAYYTLTIENGLRIGEPQSYALSPSLLAQSAGLVDVHMQLGDEPDYVFITTTPNALREEGLLICITCDSESFISYSIDRQAIFMDSYIYFISGRVISTFFLSGRDRVSSLDSNVPFEWIVVPNNPGLRRIPINNDPFLVWPSNWEENEWIEAHIVERANE